tara:strand:- start:1173 stop:1544 length:372 start_codon:yes stop_codon:yes gene_type:complete
LDVKNKKINIKEKLIKINEYWSPKVIAEMNNYQFKLAKVKGEFIWHSHDSSDEVFIIIDGKMNIELRDEIIKLSKGEMYVVPKGVEHKPYAEKECQIMLIEPKEVVNTGKIKNKYTSPNDIWI